MMLGIDGNWGSQPQEHTGTHGMGPSSCKKRLNTQAKQLADGRGRRKSCVGGQRPPTQKAFLELFELFACPLHRRRIRWAMVVVSVWPRINYTISSTSTHCHLRSADIISRNRRARENNASEEESLLLNQKTLLHLNSQVTKGFSRQVTSHLALEVLST